MQPLKKLRSSGSASHMEPSSDSEDTAELPRKPAGGGSGAKAQKQAASQIAAGTAAVPPLPLDEVEELSPAASDEDRKPPAEANPEVPMESVVSRSGGSSARLAAPAPGRAPGTQPQFPQIVEKLQEQQLDDEEIEEILQQLLDQKFKTEERLLHAVRTCLDEQSLVERLTQGGFKLAPASYLATAIEKIRGPTGMERGPTSHVSIEPQPAIALHDILQQVRVAAADADDADDVLLCVVKAAGGERFLPAPGSTEKIQFAWHEFAHAELSERPEGLTWLVKQWNTLLRSPPPAQDTKKANPLWATAAAPGCGKSHFVDELYHTLQQENPDVLDETALSGSKVMCLRASFNSNWGFHRTIEENWTAEQQLIARAVCVACECNEWVEFARWFASTSLMRLTLRQLVKEILPPSLVVLLLDETLLLRGERTDGEFVTDLYHMVSGVSDEMFRTPAVQTRVLSLVTSLHSTYLQQVTTATGRPIQYVQLDRLDPRKVISGDRWEMFYKRIGQPQEGCVDPAALLFDMCMGHPRSIATVSKYLSGAEPHPNHQPGANEPLDTYITAVAGLISIRVVSVWEDFANLECLFPVFLDLKVPGSDGDHVPLAAQLVLQGFYVNDFEAANAAGFVPVTTAYQLYNFFRTYAEPEQGAIHGLEASVATIRKKMTERQPTRLDPLLPAFFHLRLEAMHAAVQGLPRHFGAEVELQLYPFLFHDDRNSYRNRVGLIEVNEAQTYRLGLTDLVLLENRLRHGTCAGFPDAYAEQLLSIDDPSFTTFVLPKRGNNFAADFAIRTWCRRVSQPTAPVRATRATRHQQYQDSRLRGLTIFGQNKQAQRSYLSATNVRKAIHKLQKIADEYLARRPAGSDEVVVLLLVLLCTDPEDINAARVMTNSKMHEAFTYTEKEKDHELPAVRYPVVILARSDVFGLLGSCYTNFFHGQLLASIQAEAQRQTIEQERTLQAKPVAKMPAQQKQKRNKK